MRCGGSWVPDRARLAPLVRDDGKGSALAVPYLAPKTPPPQHRVHPAERERSRRIPGTGRGDAGDQTIHDAIAVPEAGAVAVVLEMVPAELATQITGKLTIPTIGIGAGPNCDAQVLVWQDMAGLTARQNREVRQAVRRGRRRLTPRRNAVRRRGGRRSVPRRGALLLVSRTPAARLPRNASMPSFPSAEEALPAMWRPSCSNWAS